MSKYINLNGCAWKIIYGMLVLLCSCGNDNLKTPSSNNIKEIKGDSSNGNYWIGTVYKDSIRVGAWKIFYKNGSLEAECNYIDGKRDGKASRYYPSGNKSAEGYFRNGLEDSLQLYYYDNGNISEKYYANKGKIKGEDYQYYENGNLREYSFYDLDGKKVYQRIYNSQGDLTTNRGNAIIYLFCPSPLMLSDTMKIAIVCATPPDCKFSLIFKETNNLFPPVDLTNGLEQNEATYLSKLKKAGSYKLKASLVLKNNKTGLSEEFYRAGEIIVQ